VSRARFSPPSECCPGLIREARPAGVVEALWKRQTAEDGIRTPWSSVLRRREHWIGGHTAAALSSGSGLAMQKVEGSSPFSRSEEVVHVVVNHLHLRDPMPQEIVEQALKTPRESHAMSADRGCARTSCRCWLATRNAASARSSRRRRPDRVVAAARPAHAGRSRRVIILRCSTR
jgi:hypothetical protein